MSAFADKLAALSPEKRALLESRLLSRKSPGSQPRHAVAPAPPELSFAQQSMWFLDRLQPESAFYTIPQAMRLRGPLDVEALRKSFEAVVARHEVLRTNLAAVDGAPQPRPASAKHFELPVVLIAPEERGKIDELVNAEARRPFDLETDLMIRATLLRLDEQEHILLLTVHHIASDLWSFSVLYRELASFYETFKNQTAPNHPPLRFQYSDFACAQREFLQSAEYQRQLAFWKNQLSGEFPELNLPLDHPRPKTPRFRGARKMICLNGALTNRLKSLGQSEGVTLFVTLLAAFQTLLHRYGGQEEIILGTPIADRDRFETEDLIGYFLNTVVLRADLSGDPAFGELLRRSRDLVFGAFANRAIPFEKLVDELRIPRHAEQNPVFQTIFQFLPGGVPVLNLKDAQTELLESESGTSKMDLVFTLGEENGTVTGHLEYNSDLFEPETIERMLTHYTRLLEAVAENPAQKISQLNFLSDAERQVLLFDWNATVTPYPREQLIHELFEAQARKTPDAIALVFGEQTLNYDTLNRRADSLAGHLRECGVGADTLVGICLDRSVELIIGLLAILKAGGAYVPLDANLPGERLQFLIRDTAVSRVITDKAIAQPNIRKIDPRDFPEANTHFSPLPASPENLAYVMYTSGSTGQPKGVAVPHRAVVRLVRETNFMGFGADEIFLQLAPASFDAATLEIWGSLLNGAKLVIHPPTLPSLEELGRTLREQKITTLWLTAGLFHQMVEHQIESLRGVRQLLAGGDVLSVPHVQKVLAQLPDCQLINGYGPTENTTFTCCFPVPRNWPGDRSVPIGKPVSNTQVYILDAHLQPVPAGVPGELFAGGDGLARGYLNAPELTAEKFIANPFKPGERLYRTGDKARWRTDGTVEFLGRLDRQLKLRGFRIEPGEIESAIIVHPLVRQSVVIVSENEISGKQLVAYVTSEPGNAVTAEELRAFLEQSLPAYMIPSFFVSLDEIPLTQNGKVDRRRLPVPSIENTLSTAAVVAPRNDMEQKLFDIWREVLGHDGFGVQENFFQIGGHSLLATRIVTRIAHQFKIEFPLWQIFESPTIAALSRAVATTSAKRSSQPELKRRAAPNRSASAVTPSGKPVETLVAAQSQTETHANILGT